MIRFRLLMLACAFVPAVAHAGGFEIPDNNTEALGRGAAFTAKADDASAQEYNIAGFARQRGTRTLLSLNVVFHNYEFTRSGTYPGDPTDAKTPYAGQPFPTIRNGSGPFPAPFFGISTDFGKLDRWTFAAGIFGPSSYGNTNFGVTVNGLPSPGRYDFAYANLLIIYPTLAAAVRVTKWLDLGLALHLVVGSFELSNVAFVDLGRGVPGQPGICPSVEYAPCDSQSIIKASGVSATAALGIMFHPLRTLDKALDVGLNLRGPIYLDATGTASGTPPQVQSTLPIDAMPATFHARLPWVLRAGVRYAFLKDGFERGDVEVDGSYEAWNAVEGDGTKINIPQLSIFSDINPTVTHHYRDTFSVRVGGAYNLQLPTGVLTFRLGFFYDSPATALADTRIDFDTAEKIAPTVGLGYRVRGVSINLAYAYLWSPDRDVSNGDIRPINPVRNGTSGSSEGENVLLPPVNNGHYHANSQILSVSVNVAWDEALKKKRVLTYE